MAQAPAQQGGSDSGLGPFWVALLLLLTCVGIWFAFKAYIVMAVVQVKLYEAYMVGFFTSQLDALRDTLINLIPQLRMMGPDLVTFEDIQYISKSVGEYTRYPIILLLLLMAVLLYRTDVTSRFKKIYNMNRLREAEWSNWPQISPIVKLNLIGTPLMKGPWSMALNPIEFSVKHNLMRKEITPGEKQSRRAAKELRWTIARGEAKRVFTLQLGAYWEGEQVLPVHARALFAIFCGKINRDRSGADALLEQINRSSITGKLDFTGHKELIKKHAGSKAVQRIIGGHAYVLTVMGAMIEASRTDGVFASSNFLWLKPVDRSLWYMLNCVGRQTPYVEVAGPFAHLLAEKRLQRKSMVPMVDEAVKALEIAVKEVKYTPKEED